MTEYTHLRKSLCITTLVLLGLSRALLASVAEVVEVAPRSTSALAEVCGRASQLLDSKFENVGIISDRVFQENGDPIARARALQSELHVNASALGSKDFPDGGVGVFWRSNNLTDLRAYRHNDLDTIMVHSRYGLIPEGSKMLVVWGHGWTSMESHTGGVVSRLNFMVSRKMGGSYAALKDPKTGNFVPAAAVSVDAPFHGAGPRNPELSSLEAGLDWRLQFYDQMRVQSKGLPRVIATTSGESLMAHILNHRHPELFDAQISVGPVHPKAGLIEGLEGYIKDKMSTTTTSGNPQTFRWMESILNEIHALPEGERWWESAQPLGNPVKPLLVLVGSEDRQTPAETRQEYKRLASLYPGKVFYVEIPGAGHNVFATKSEDDKARAQLAWKHVYHFLRSQVLDDPNTNPIQ